MAIAGRWTFESLGVRRRRAGGWGAPRRRPARDDRDPVVERCRSQRSESRMSGAGSRGLTAARGCQCMPAVTAAVPVANAHDFTIPTDGHVHDEHTHGPATIVYPLSIFLSAYPCPRAVTFSHITHICPAGRRRGVVSRAKPHVSRVWPEKCRPSSHRRKK